jgi:hypothetical protein
VEPKRYCQQAIQEIRRRMPSEPPTEAQQRLVVLAYFAEEPLETRDFASRLKLLADSSERSGRPTLAAAARAVLEDWETKRAVSVNA